MKNSTQQSLWCNSRKRLYFLIPDNKELPVGTFLICKLRGVEKRVNLESLTPYKISVADAESYMKQEVTQALEEISNLLSNTVGAALRDFDQAQTVSEGAENSTQSMTILLTNLLGTSLEEFIENPAAAKEGLQNFVVELSTTMQNNEESNSEPTQFAKTSVEAVLEVLQSRGLEIPEFNISQIIEDLARSIAAFSENLVNNHTKDTSSIETAVTQIREAPFQIDSSFSDLSQTFMQGVEKLRNLTDELQEQSEH